MKVAIIGGGASGLMLGALISKLNINYDIFNSGKLGRKILASGNGRCNIANTNIDKKYYHDNKLLSKLLVNKDKVFNLFKELNIYTKEDGEGRLYPISESSLSVLNILLKNNKGNIIDLFVNNIKNKGDKYYVENYGPYDKIIICTGSYASFKNSFSYDYLKSLNVKFNDFKPSLVGFKVKENIKAISGVRCKCNVSLYSSDKLIHKESGEIIFKDDGISGICVMNLSSYYQHLDNQKSKIVIDLLDNKKYNTLESVINPKLLDYINKYNLDPNKIVLNIKSTYDFEFAQVCVGGIDINYINDNLSLKSDSNIYVMGEVIDCDGVCGGYNLFFAWLCSITVYEDLKNEISNK
ncbi:MAG: NAD(P)/FAD-dependent oxidoreductase [Acholeplasmatales bacterium]|nr:NAD(P)/FAD-dependent oxidoreductase [Acholeplasmatales bacterium]